MMNYSLYSIVKKLCGNIEPYGETNHDEEALDNLRGYREDFELLFTDIVDISNKRDSDLYSVKLIGKEAFEILKDIINIMLDDKDIYEYIKEQINEIEVLEDASK